MCDWIKFHIIKLKGLILNKTAVDFMGSSYLIGRNTIKRIG